MESKQTLKAQVERELNQKDPSILKGLSAEKRAKLIETVAITMVREHRGPLPSPDVLEQYNQAVPDGANRIMTIFEEQARHRMGLESRALDSQVGQSARGQWLGFAIGVIALGAGFGTILTGHEWPGTVLGVGGITSLVYTFVTGKNYMHRELREKKQE